MHERIRQRFDAPVTHHALDKFSFLVVAFGRCKFKLSVDSVGLLLQAALGGCASHFFIQSLGERVFRFAVSFKRVGFFINLLRFFSCDEFLVFFHLWGNGGPNWRLEFRLFLHEEDASWSRPKPRRSFVEVLRAPLLDRNPGKQPAVVNRRCPKNLAWAPPLNPHKASSSVAGAPLSRANSIPLGGAHAGAQPQPAANNAMRGILSGANTIPLGSSRPVGPTARQCSRCLSYTHWRVSCHRPICCRTCRCPGHIAAFCPKFKFTRGQQNPLRPNGRVSENRGQRWKQCPSTAQPPPAQPLSIKSKGDPTGEPPLSSGGPREASTRNEQPTLAH